jgi:predicted transcriptional regulator
MARVLISVPDDLLAHIDREARSRGVSRSRFMREAALQQLGWPDAQALEAALTRGQRALADAPTFESADLIADERRQRDERDRRR